MPLGKYPDFQSCVDDQKSKGHDDLSSRKICGTIEKKVNASLLNAIDYNDCLSQAKDFGHDDEASHRICDSLTGKADDPEDMMDHGIDENTESDGQGKQAWYDPTGGINSNSGTEDPLEGGDQDSPMIGQMTTQDGQSYDMGNDGPNMDGVDPTPNEAGFEPPSAYSVDNPTIGDNDHVGVHMDQSQKDTYDQMDDMPNSSDMSSMQGLGMNSAGNIAMKDPGAAFSNGILEEGHTAKSDSAQYAPFGASAELKLELIKRFGSFKSAAKDAQVTPFESNGKLFVKAFLLDTSLNQNAWGVAPHTLDANINSYIGKPLVLNESFDHPDSGDDNLDHQLQYQELYRIGTVIDVVKSGSRYDAIAEVTDPYAVDAFHQGELPIYVSPQLYKQDPAESDSAISKWSGTHLAIVKNPAYGVKVAQYKGSCTGSSDICVAYLKKASVIKEHGYGNCGYCNRKILLSAAVIKSDAKVNVAPKVSSSLDSSEQNTDVNILEERKDEKTIAKEAAPNTGKPTLDVALAENEKLKQKLLIATKANEEHVKVNESLSQRVGSLEQERRKDQISTILSAAEFEQDGFSDKVNSLAKSSLPIEEINSIFKPLVEAKSANKVKSASTVEPQTQYVESKVSMKNASTEVGPMPNNGKPAWLVAREHLFSGGKL